MNLNSIERALLADLVQPHEHRWKKPLQRMTSSIPEEDPLERSGKSDASVKSDNNPTLETMMETQMSPTSELHKPVDGESLSSVEVDDDGLYCAWSVVREEEKPQDAVIQDALPNMELPTIGGFNTETMLALKNGVSLSRTHVIDDVSSIASSEHSGRIMKSHNPRLSYRRKVDANKLSIVSTLSSWRNSNNNSKSKLSSRAQTMLMREYEEEEEDNLEEEVFAVEDARHAKIVKEAMGLMESVNKSVVSMGMEAPFRSMEEVSCL
jgi:hypothetical protein